MMTRITRTTTLLVVVLFVFVAGCAKSPKLAQTETFTVKPTETVTRSPSPDFTKPTKRWPTEEPIPTWTDTLTLEPSLTYTPDPRRVLERACGGYADESSFSPDFKWVVCTEIGSFTVANGEGAIYNFPFENLVETTVDLSNYINPQAVPIHWSKDDSVVYVTFAGTADSPTSGYEHGNGLFKINLATGILSVVLPLCLWEPCQDSYGSFSISMTGRRLVYVDHNNSPLSITIVDLATGNSHRIPLDKIYTDAGQFLWSDDGLTLITAMAAPGKGEEFWVPGFTDIMITDMNTFASSIFRIDKAGYLTITEYRENIIYFRNDDRFWSFNLNNLSINIEPTPDYSNQP